MTTPLMSRLARLARLVPLAPPIICAALGAAAIAADATPASATPSADSLAGEAQAWLLAQQTATGTFGPPDAKMSLGITALAVEALCQQPGLDAGDPRIAKAVAVLKAAQQPDGGFYKPEEGLAVYGTSICLTALIEAKAADPALIAKAQAFLAGCQVTGAVISAGGIGYGGPKSGASTHADLSNTHMALRALRDSGLPATDPHVVAVIPFLEHCQQLSAVNHLPWVSMAPDQAGGAVYNPDPQARPAAGATAGGSATASASVSASASATASGAAAASRTPPIPTAYGSMTWALVDSYEAAGVPLEDQRMQAALGWIGRHYSLASNAGRPEAKAGDGLYYGYWMMSQALARAGVPTIALADGQAVDWRAGLLAAIAERAHADAASGGAYWLNDAKNWAEANPLVVTSYMLETLKNMRPGAAGSGGASAAAASDATPVAPAPAK